MRHMHVKIDQNGKPIKTRGTISTHLRNFRPESRGLWALAGVCVHEWLALSARSAPLKKRVGLKKLR